jgi:hypothetical protein
MDIISDLPTSWSARTFRDIMSKKLYTEGRLMEGAKIERSTTPYFLHQLGIELDCPKKRRLQRRARESRYGASAEGVYFEAALVQRS